MSDIGIEAHEHKPSLFCLATLLIQAVMGITVLCAGGVFVAGGNVLLAARIACGALIVFYVAGWLGDDE